MTYVDEKLRLQIIDAIAFVASSVMSRNQAAAVCQAVLPFIEERLSEVESSRRDWAAEAEYRRREAEFEANAEPWGPGTIVAPEGHGYINGGNCCECGYATPTLRTYERHTRSLLRACACVADEQADQLIAAGFSRPVCAVHPEGGAS